MGRFRYLTAGESHGPRLSVIVEGVPAGLRIAAADIDAQLTRRQQGFGRSGRMKIEHDQCVISAGIRGGESLGSPIALHIENRDHANWLDRMPAEPFAVAPEALTMPRPGHADLAGSLKYDRHDARDVLERASARETAARVAAGAIARRLLDEIGVRIAGRVVSIAGVSDTVARSPDEIIAAAEALDRSELRALDAEHEVRMRAEILARSHDGDTAGGVVEIVAVGVPIGLGSHVQSDRRIDGRLAQAAMSIQAIKAVEIGDGWASASLPGSRVHDAIGYDPTRRKFTRASNHAGGVEGGMTNGEPVVIRAAMKPLATLRAGLASVDLHTKESGRAAFERSDVCAVPAAVVILEAAVAVVLADAALEKFGGDSLRELLRNVAGYREQLEAF